MEPIQNIIKTLHIADNLGLNDQVDACDIRLAQILDNNNNTLQQQQVMMLLQQMQILNREIVNLKNTMMEMQRNYNSAGGMVGAVPTPNLTIKAI